MTNAQLSLSPIDLKQAVIRNPLALPPEAPLSAAVIEMCDSHLPKVSAVGSTPSLQNSPPEQHLSNAPSAVLILENHQLLGILTERDIVRLISQGCNLESQAIRQVMTQPVITAQESALTDVFSAFQLLQNHRIRHLPILDDQNQLTGLITFESLWQIAPSTKLLRLRLAHEVMQDKVACASLGLSVVAIAQRMVAENLDTLVIVDSPDCPHSDPNTSPKPLGIITERDLVQFQATPQTSKLATARDIMMQPLGTVHPDTSLWEIQQLMKRSGAHTVPVTGASGEFLGIVTPQTLLQASTPLELYKLTQALEPQVTSLEVQTIRLLQERNTKLEQQAKRQRIVSELTDQIRSSLSLETLLETTVTQLRKVLDCDRVNIWQFASDGRSTAVAKLTQSSPSLLGEHISDLSIPPPSASNPADAPGGIRVINDVTQANLSESYRAWLLRLQVQASISISLRRGEQAWGWLQISESQRSRQWTTEEIELLQALSSQLAIALQQATTHHQLQTDLSIREQTAAKLKESEERYRIVYDQSVVGFASVGLDGVFEDVNHSLCEMLGYSREELLLKGPAEITHPENRSAISEDLGRLFSGQTSKFSQEKRYLRKDGSCFWGQVEVSLARDKAGKPKYTLAVVQDISDRKQAELALQNLIEGTSKTTGKEFFPTLVHYIGKALEVDYVLVSKLVEDELQVIAYCYNGMLQPTFKFPLANTPCERVCKTGRLYIEHCVQQEFPEHLDLVEMEAESYLGISLNSANDQSIGNLCILNKQPIKDCQRAEQILRVFAARASVELERQKSSNALEILNKSLESQVETRTAELKLRENIIRQHAMREKLLRVISQRVRKSLDLDIIFQTACHEVRKILRADRVSIFQLHLSSKQDYGNFVAESVAKGFESLLSQEVREDVFCENYSALYENGRFFLTNDVHSDSLSDCHREFLVDLQVRSTLVMPLLCKGELWGLLCIHQCEAPREWQKHDIEFAKQLANQLAIAIQQASLFEQLQQELSERQQAEKALTERNLQLAVTNEELARATRLKDEFLANMSHELRTPLNAILGMSECLKENVLGKISEPQHSAIETIHSSGSHLLSLINEILDLSKIQAGQIKLKLEPVSIAPLCESSLIFVKQQALKKGIALNVNIPAELTDLFLLDQRRILQCLINLLTNAVKFTPKSGKVTLKVTHVEPPIPLDSNNPAAESPEDNELQHQLEFSIIDTGIGIGPQDLDKVFQPFIQIDSSLSRKYDGTGLGLALVKRIVELHGGHVSVESELGQGSTFTLNLPCRVATAPLKGLPIISSHRGPEASFNQPDQQSLPLILLAEDNEAGISTFTMFLQSKGYRLEIARDGLEAISQAQATHPDLILMDIQMPKMDGLEAMRHIRLDPKLAQVPIIALTALAMKGDQERCLTAGANDYLSKPVKLTQLVGAIEKLLQASAARP